MQVGWTPLHAASHFGHIDTVRTLLGAEVNVHAESKTQSKTVSFISWKPLFKFVAHWQLLTTCRVRTVVGVLCFVFIAFRAGVKVYGVLSTQQRLPRFPPISLTR